MPLPAAEQVSSALSQQVFQHHNVQHCVHHQPLQLCVLFLKLFQASGIRHVHPAIFGLQLVKARGADAVLAADICHSQPVDVYVDPVSLIIPIICVSVKRLFRMRLLLQGWADSTLK